jgi:hypothetical protein
MNGMVILHEAEVEVGTRWGSPRFFAFFPAPVKLPEP